VNENKKVDRRNFFGAGLAGIGALGTGGVAGWFASRAPRAPPERPALGPRFTYDIGDYVKTDPSLLLYDESAKIAADSPSRNASRSQRTICCFAAATGP